jgi:hypothetical protein
MSSAVIKIRLAFNGLLTRAHLRLAMRSIATLAALDDTRIGKKASPRRLPQRWLRQLALSRRH